MYESWGQHSGAYGSMAATLGELNPFRYRGYYYDQESGLYYLNSRYYDPEIGRFLNADGVIGANQHILTYNLFAYCGSNPVIRADYNGNSFLESFINTSVLERMFIFHGTENRSPMEQIDRMKILYNLKHDTNELVYGQNHVDMVFGSTTVSESGCGIVALHNALYMLGRGSSLAFLVQFFDRQSLFGGGIFGGELGAFIWGINAYLNAAGVPTDFRLFPSPTSVDSIIQNSRNQMAIVSINWHYFYVKWTGSNYIALNYFFAE